jgi:putative ABC transport system substrate-binding protein
MWRIGLCHVGLDHEPPSLPSLKAELAQLGYVDKGNLVFDWRNQATDETARTTMQEWVRAKYDLIVAFEDQCVRAAQTTTSTIPIVFVHASDPVLNGYVKSFSHPGTNLTGPVSNLNLVGKTIELFKEINPALRTLFVLTNHKDAASKEEGARQAADALGLQLIERDTPTLAEIERAFSELPRGVAQGIVSVSPDLWTNFGSTILALSQRAGIPVAGNRKERVEGGALFSYAPDFAAVGPLAAHYVDRILKGRKPDQLPVDEVSEVKLVVNLEMARRFGLTIPPSILTRAETVIETEPSPSTVDPHHAAEQDRARHQPESR